MAASLNRTERFFKIDSRISDTVSLHPGNRSVSKMDFPPLPAQQSQASGSIFSSGFIKRAVLCELRS